MTNSHTFSIAPMLDWTDRHQRFFMRLISKHARLYTEMITTGALIYNDPERYLPFNKEEHPVAVQLGGNHPDELARCAQMAQDYGYDEVNLNVGCPSDRVKNGRFGACLMATPEVVAEAVAAMKAQVNIPVTVKHRIGIDEQDSWEELCHFVETVAAASCDAFIVHARKAWLQGLSPKQNREVPPLKYDVVHRLKKTYPHLNIIINGGIISLEQTLQQLEYVDGVMIGREAYHNPYAMVEFDGAVFHDPHPLPSRFDILEQLYPYIEKHLAAGGRLHDITRHIFGLFLGQPNAKIWRRYLSENAPRKGAGINVLKQATDLLLK